MKNSLLIASLLSVMSASAFAQTAQTVAKPGATLASTSTSAVASKPGATPVAPARMGPDPEKMAQMQVARFDTNKDGKVSLEEFLVPANTSFKRTDLNHDGFVTVAELVEANKRQMAELMKMQAKMAQAAPPSTPSAPAKPAK